MHNIHNKNKTDDFYKEIFDTLQNDLGYIIEQGLPFNSQGCKHFIWSSWCDQNISKSRDVQEIKRTWENVIPL